MLKAIAVVVVILVAGLGAVLVYAATLPDEFRVQRRISINAPPEAIFPLVNDHRRVAAWSPYERKDPAMKRAYSGAASGKGAVYEWDGDGNVGKGRIEIVESVASSKVTLKLDMIKPIAGRNTVEFTLQPQGESTVVTWAMHGAVPYMAKLFCMLMNGDRMVGDDFEAGLANLKTLAEREASQAQAREALAR
jgi:carbon monoxide dehydrogenase subunit G